MPMTYVLLRIISNHCEYGVANIYKKGISAIGSKIGNICKFEYLIYLFLIRNSATLDLSIAYFIILNLLYIQFLL